MGDASGAFVAALAHLTEASFPFPKIWSLYPAIFGQAIPSAFGRFRLAVTLWLGGIGIHLWTAIIAFVYGGFISAFITFMLPVVGEAFWAWKSYVYSGYFWNSYIFILVLYLAVWILVLFSSFILSVYSDN